MKKTLVSYLSLILFFWFFCSCNNSKNRIKEGKIEYEISYPCLEKNHESLMFLLPKKMVMTFNGNVYKNEFIFPTKGSELGLINDCNTKNLKLIFGLGNNNKFTSLDSSSIYYLLDDLPTYEIIYSDGRPFDYLGTSCKEIKVKSLENDSIYNIITANEIDIKDVNWCTPFNEIPNVLLDYNIKQYGMEMHLKAIKINKEYVKKDFNELDENFNYLKIKNYLSEIKTMLSIFKCND